MKNLLTELTKAQKRFIIQIIFTTSFVTLTSGVFMSGLATHMGADDILVNYISNITNVCGLFVMAFFPLIRRVKSQKKLTVWLMIFSRLATFALVLIPFIVPLTYQLFFFVPIILVAFTAQGLAAVALNHWLAFNTPDKKRGTYISIRQTLSLIVSVILPILGGMFLDSSEKQQFGFLAIFLFALVMGACEVIVLLRIEDNSIVPEKVVSGKKSVLLGEVFRNKKFMLYLLRVTLFCMSLFLADCMTFIFMNRYLNLSYTTITLLQMIMSLPQVFLLVMWGRISDKRGHKFVLNCSLWIFAGETFFLALTALNTWMIFIPLAFLSAAVANSAYVISLFNRRFEIIPEKGRMFYDGFFGACLGVAYIVAPLIGGAIRNAFLSNESIAQAFPFADIRLLYVISTVAILTVQIVFTIIERVMHKKEQLQKGAESLESLLTKDAVADNGMNINETLGSAVAYDDGNNAFEAVAACEDFDDAPLDTEEEFGAAKIDGAESERAEKNEASKIESSEHED